MPEALSEDLISFFSNKYDLTGSEVSVLFDAFRDGWMACNKRAKESNAQDHRSDAAKEPK
jgi:hypothetical protein